jgi:eukaryotic-like serine/threonine-protein kinase
MMRPERWQQVKEIFHSALALPPDKRDGFLAAACQGHDSLRREVESLISSHEKTGSFIDAPVYEVAAQIMADENKELQEGQTLSSYKIIKALGVGGMGEVYLAHDSRLNRQVALKVLPADLTNNREHLRRFEQEARAASALNHPNVITIYEIGSRGDTHFIATEFIEGQTLRPKLQMKQVEIAEALNIATQIAAALDAAHRRGIVHRDIKPENIMVREDGLVKVLDFGLAKLTEKMTDASVDTEAPTRQQMRTMPGMVMGTARYMSPEQARGKEVDARTDIWSLGVVLYEMLAGKSPFAGETTSDTISAILSKNPAPLSAYCPDIPKELERLVGKTLRKNREERYQHIEDLLIDLKDFKQELEFSEKLERSAAPSKNEEATAGKATVVTEAQNAQTTSRAGYIFRKIKQHKRGYLAALTILLLAVMGLGYWFYSNRAASTNNKQIKSIAVLPLENLSGDASQDYFADGMTDAVITELAKLENLSVISRNSTMQFKGARKKIAEIAGELNVDAVIEGTVLRSGDKVRISLQMFHAASGQNIWSNSYERDIREVLALQSEVSRGIVSEIKVKLSAEERANLSRQTPVKPEAQDALFRGRYFFYQAVNTTTPNFNERKVLFEKSIEYFQQAIGIEPKHAEAYAALATSCIWFGGFGSDEYFPKAIEAANKAIQIDETNAEAHNALAYSTWNHKWDAVTAEKEYKRAIELDSNQGHHGYALLLSALGRHDEAIREMKLAENADPLNVFFKYIVAFSYANAGQYDEALEQWRYLTTLNPNHLQSQIGLAESLTYKGMYQEALAETQKVLEMTKTPPESSLDLAWVYAMAGRREEAIKILNESRKQPEEKLDPVGIARIYAALGDKDQAVFWLEKSIPLRKPGLRWLKVSPEFNKMRDDARFQDLLRRVGLMP